MLRLICKSLWRHCFSVGPDVCFDSVCSLSDFAFLRKESRNFDDHVFGGETVFV